MIESKFRLLSSPLVIQSKINSIIEAFVDFYGEEKRVVIEEKLKNTLIVKFCSNSNLETIINDIEVQFFKEIFNISDNINLSFFDIKGLKDLISILEKGEENLYLYLSSDIKDICFNGESEVKNVIENCKKGLYPKFDEYVKKYKEFEPRLLPFVQQVEREKNRIHEIDNKYYDILVSEFSYLFNEKELESYKKHQFKSGKISEYLGYSLMSSAHCFSIENENILNDPNSSKWKKESIISDRIKFLKNNGFNIKEKNNLLNDAEYEDYLNDPECLEFINKTFKLIEIIENRKKELNDLRIKDIVYGYEDYKECNEIIENMNFVDKNNYLGPFVYQSPVSCAQQNFIKVNNQYKPYQLVLINAGMGDIETTIIHELNHVYESCVIHLDEKGCIYTTGWDTETCEFKNKKESDELEYSGITRPYELMSEYINDRISEEICNKMLSKGDYVFNPYPERKGSAYRYVDFILEGFYQSFKSIIIESRSNANIQYIFDNLGKDNFEALNNLVNKYYDIFGFNMSGRMVVIDYLKGHENPKAYIIEEIINERDKILNNMNIHLNNINVSL